MSRACPLPSFRSVVHTPPLVCTSVVCMPTPIVTLCRAHSSSRLHLCRVHARSHRYALSWHSAARLHTLPCACSLLLLRSVVCALPLVHMPCCARTDLLLFRRRALHPPPTSLPSVLLLLLCPPALSPAPSPRALPAPSLTSSTSSSPPSTSILQGCDFLISASPMSRFGLSNVQIWPLRRPDRACDQPDYLCDNQRAGLFKRLSFY